MLRRRLYYALKPFLPWAMRMAVRRIFARRKREQSKAIWPIDESTSRPPEGWSGWPEGRKFAFVLTHDVEGPEGLAKCRQLAELEMKLGFRSSFNFIPEGPYQVPPELRAWLTTNGFEVGVHDLHHDGKLFSSRRGFAEKAKKINNYLREWQARGYRSGFMLRDLGWLHDLDIQYDASTFDTDPFEPQAESAGTIFPYWISSPEAPEAKDKAVSAESLNTQPSTLSSFASVSQSENCGQTPGGQQATTARPTSSFASVSSTVHRPPSTEQPPTVHRPPSTGSRAGYVELPYTLPQDSTLFLLLQEKSPDIWLRKLDWIVAHGGMALLNVHPDYINFAGTPRTNREYPEAFYAEFLHTISKKYAGQFWNPLPGKLAEWHHQTHRAASLTLPRVSEADSPPGGFTGLGGGRLRGKRAAVILFSYYPIDPRPRRAAEALVEAGMEVDLLCLSSGPDQPKNERLNGVQVYRVNIVRERSTKSRYVWQYVLFLVTAFWFLSRRSLRRRYDVVHVHNMPDILVFATLVPKIRGTKIMLDLHDPMPELMASIRLLHAASWHVTALRILERWSIRFASVVITPNIAFKNLFASRSCRPEKITIVMNSPEEAIFDRARLEQSRPLVRNKNEFRIMHHGLIAYRHGVDLLVEAVAQVRMAIPGVRLDLYGARTPFLDTVLATAERLGVADIVTFHGEIDQDGIARAILKSDLGVVPNRRSAFTDLNFPTRIFEYLAMNRPVIAPATRGIRDYFTPDQLIKFDPGNVADLVAKILWVKNQPEAVQAKVERGVRVYRAHLWSEEKAGFIDLVGNLVLGTRQYRPKRVCMITHSFYESDNRVTRYAEALAARGDQVDVLSLRRSPDLARTETINGVRVFRIQDRFGKSERSILSFLWPAVRFLISSSCRVTWRHAWSGMICCTCTSSRTSSCSPRGIPS